MRGAPVSGAAQTYTHAWEARAGALRLTHGNVTSAPIALTVSPAGALGVVEVTAGVITEVVGGPHVDTVSSGHGIGFWFNAIDQHCHPV